MSLEVPPVDGRAAVQTASSISTDVAGILRDKDRIIQAQARRIGQLEQEADRARRDRDSLATKVALLTYKLQMYSKDQQQSVRQAQAMNLTDGNQPSENRSCEKSSQLQYSSNRASSFTCPNSKQPASSICNELRGSSSSGYNIRPLPPHPKPSNITRSSPSDKLQQRHHRFQKRTSEEDDKIKRSRDWDYELSQDLQAKQIEMLEKKYGGSLRACRAASIIQQAYRQYCLNKNFAKLRLEADKKRLSRRFTDLGRSRTLWTDLGTTVESGRSAGIPLSNCSTMGHATAFDQPLYANIGSGVRAEDRVCSRVITQSSSAFASYYCKILQKSLSMSVTSSEQSIQREYNQLPARYAPNADLNAIREVSWDSNFGVAEKSRNDHSWQMDSSQHRVIPIQTTANNAIMETLVNDADSSEWHMGRIGSSGNFNINGNEDDLAVSTGALPSYVDHNVIDNNLDYDIEGNTPDQLCLTYSDMPLTDSPYCDHKCILHGMPEMGQGDLSSGNYCDRSDAVQVCRIPSTMMPPPIQTGSPSNNVYSSLRLCSWRHGTPPPASPNLVENSALKQSYAGSPVWKRKNSGEVFGYSFESEAPESRNSLSGESPHLPSSVTVSDSYGSGGAGGMIVQPNAYLHNLSGTCNDCAQLLHMSRQHHHHHLHHHHHHHSPTPHHHHVVPQPKVSDKQRKRTYRIGLNLFNKKPEKGIRYLMERRFLDNRPNAVARFLISRKGLSKQMIGEYLGNLQKQFNMEVLRCFADEIDLVGLEIDVALRKFQSFFRMPGEAQKIERLMEAFASRYCQCNPHVVQTFRRADTVFLLAFATIMLNTDLHNKSIKQERKMKLNDFIRNLRGIDDGEDIDPNLLTGIYERIKLNEFQAGSDHVSQVAKVEQSIVGKRPQLAALHRRLVCYCRLYEVQDLSRREKLGLHQREVFLFNDMLMVTKILGKKKNSVSYSFRSSFSLSGMIVYLFDTPYYKYGIRLTCNSSKKDYVMLYARNEHDRSKFVEDLKEAILEMNEMEALRIEEELQKQKIQQKHCNYNRHSKDSGVVDIELLRPSDFAANRHSTADCVSVSRAPISGSLVDMTDCSHRGSAGSLDSGLVSINAQCDHLVG